MIPSETVENFVWLNETINDKNNAWHCDKCHSLLPMFITLIKSKVKIGSKFYVKCRKCKYVNERIKKFGKNQCKFCGSTRIDPKKKICKKCKKIIKKCRKKCRKKTT